MQNREKNMRHCLYLLCYILLILYAGNEGYAQVGIEISDAKQLSLESEQLKNKKLDDLCTLDYQLMSRPEYMTLLNPDVDKTKIDKVLPCETDSLLQKISHIFDEWEESVDIGNSGSCILPTTVFNPSDNVAINARSLRGQVRQVFRLIEKCITIAHVSENHPMEIKFYRQYIKYMNSLKNTDIISYHMKWAAIENLLIIADTYYDSYSKTEKEDILTQLKKMKNILTSSLIEGIINERFYLVQKLYYMEYCEDIESIKSINNIFFLIWNILILKLLLNVVIMEHTKR